MNIALTVAKATQDLIEHVFQPSLHYLSYPRLRRFLISLVSLDTRFLGLCRGVKLVQEALSGHE